MVVAVEATGGAQGWWLPENAYGGQDRSGVLPEGEAQQR